MINLIVKLFAARLVPDADTKEVASDPPNIKTNPVKRGNIESVLFGKVTRNCNGDPFKEAALQMTRKENRAHQIEVGNDKAFRPAKHFRQDPYHAAFEHMQDFVHVDKNFRDPENNNEVMIPPRNMLINPPKKGIVGKQTTFSGVTPYIASDYELPKKIATKERLAGAALIETTHNNKPFSQ